MDMVGIKRCDVTTCAYNSRSGCHTPGITVGAHGECNTYNHGSRTGGSPEIEGGVGACLASDCQFNSKLECTAPIISVESHSEHADCGTFQPRK